MHEPSLVVSLHDVSPKTHHDCAAILTELASLGVPHCSLLVIPNHHHSGHFLENPHFSHWLQLQTSLGHEPVIHGYYHQRPRKPRESLLAKWTTRIYTADEGEFFDLSHADSLALLHQAQADFKKLHLHPTGFIAPAWLLGPLAQSALPSTPGSYTTRLGSVLHLATNLSTHSQSLVWSVRSPLRRSISLLWNAFLFRRLQSNPLLRISIHPVDRHHPRIWSQIRRLLAQSLTRRQPKTYQSWLADLTQSTGSSHSKSP